MSNPDWASLPLFDRKGWKRMHFGEFAESVNERADPKDAQEEIYVGLEHLDPQCLHIRRWGKGSDVTGAKLRFRDGEIIFGRRRAYQRKLAVAKFDGICSAHALVVRAKPDRVLPEFLPFLMMSDRFMNRAVEISVGSLSPTINWTTLKLEEFDLPSLDQQRRIAEILWAVDACICSYERISQDLDTLCRARIAVAMGIGGRLGDVQETLVGKIPQGWKAPMLREICTVIADGVHKTPRYVENGVPFVTVKNLTRAPGISFDDLNYISEADHAEFIKRTHPEKGDVLLSKDGATLGVPRVVETDRPFSIFVSVALLKPDRSKIDPYYLFYALQAPVLGGRLIKNQTGSAIRHIHLVDLRTARMPLPPLNEQIRFVETIGEAVKASDSQRRLLSLIKDVAAQMRTTLFSHNPSYDDFHRSRLT
jgi:restriction endonuclease S subunit